MACAAAGLVSERVAERWRIEVNGYGRWRVIENGCPEYWANAKYFRSRKRAERWLARQVEHEVLSEFYEPRTPSGQDDAA